VAGGYVHADVLDDDRELLLVLLGSEGAEAGPEAVAQLAQTFRLPVTPYRPLSALIGQQGIAELSGGASVRPLPGVGQDRPLSGVTVVDHSVLWAGPMCTWLLAELGAAVVKIEPDSRPDGYRNSPEGHVFAALDRGKRHEALDLSRTADRRRYLELVAGADLVVDNLSARARANLGIERAALAEVNPDILTLSFPAFSSEPGRGKPGTGDRYPSRDWVAYGAGVHAALGLGSIDQTLGAGPVAPPLLAYPDPLTGLAGLVAALAMLVGRSAGNGAGRAVVSLESAVLPLVAWHDGGRSLLSPAQDIGVALAGGMTADYPSSPIRLIADDATWDAAEQAAGSAWDASGGEEIEPHQRDTVAAIARLLRHDQPG
jgi:hypothetical protein